MPRACPALISSVFTAERVSLIQKLDNVHVVVVLLCQAVIKSVVRRYIFERLLTSVVPSEGQQQCVELCDTIPHQQAYDMHGGGLQEREV